MKRTSGDQGTLFGPAATTRPVRRRRPPRQTAVFVTAEAIAAAKAGRINGERIIEEALRAAQPDARNVAVDLGTIRWTDPKTGRRVTFATPIAVRDVLLALVRGDAPEPFQFILGRATRPAGTIRPAVSLAPR
jgi:hypothetical protein